MDPSSSDSDPIQIFSDALFDNWAVSLAFVAAVWCWYGLRNHENRILRAIGRGMPPICAGLTPYLLAFLWFSFQPVSSATLFASDTWAARIMSHAAGAHEFLERGDWAFPLIAIVLFAAVGSTQALRGFNRSRQWVGAVGTAIAVFVAFTPLGVRTDSWDQAASAELKIEIAQAIQDQTKTLALARISEQASTTADVPSLAALTAQRNAVVAEFARPEDIKVSEGHVERPNIFVRRQAAHWAAANGRELGQALAIEVAAEPETAEDEEPVRDALAVQSGETAQKLIVLDGIGGIFLDAAVSALAEHVAALTLDHLPVRRLLDLRDHLQPTLHRIRTAIIRLPQAAFFPPRDSASALDLTLREALRTWKAQPEERQVRELEEVPAPERAGQTDEDRPRPVEHALEPVPHFAR